MSRQSQTHLFPILLSTLVWVQLFVLSGSHQPRDQISNLSIPYHLIFDRWLWAEGWPFINWFLSEGAIFVEWQGLIANVIFWTCCAAATYFLSKSVLLKFRRYQFTVKNYIAFVLLSCFLLASATQGHRFDIYIIRRLGLMRACTIPEPQSAIFAFIGIVALGSVTANRIVEFMFGCRPRTETTGTDSTSLIQGDRIE